MSDTILDRIAIERRYHAKYSRRPDILEILDQCEAAVHQRDARIAELTDLLCRRNARIAELTDLLSAYAGGETDKRLSRLRERWHAHRAARRATPVRDGSIDARARCLDSGTSPEENRTPKPECASARQWLQVFAAEEEHMYAVALAEQARAARKDAS